MSVDCRDFRQYADETALSLTRSSQNWTAFLRAAARLYKLDEVAVYWGDGSNVTTDGELFNIIPPVL